MSAPESPLALLGYPAPATRALRELGLLALAVPAEAPEDVFAACRTLRYSGALVHGSQELAVLGAVQPDAGARAAGRVDAVSFAGGLHGTFALADALSDLLGDSGYATRGASALLLGDTARDLALAAPLARLGFAGIGVVAETTPEAEAAARTLPAGVRSFPLSRRDGSLATLAERADLIVLTGGALPAGLLQPYHTLADLTGRATGTAGAGSTLDLSTLGARRLARQLAHATGQRFHIQDLVPLAAALA